MQDRSATLRDVTKRLFAVLMLLVVLGLDVLSAYEPAHAAFHANHAVPDNDDCAVCLFVKGQLNFSDLPVIPGAVFFVEPNANRLPESAVADRVEHLLPPGRAPPFSCSVS